MSMPAMLTPVFEELAITISARNHSHTLLTPDFLSSSGIVPLNWELAQPPVLDSQTAIVKFTNETIISAQFDRIVFSQTIEAKGLKEVKVPAIVRKYVETLPNADYQGVGINPSSFFTWEDEDQAAKRHYIVAALLAPSVWCDQSSQPVRGTLNLAYALEKGEFNLKIDDVRLRRSDNMPQFAVLFSGNFPYEIVGNTASERWQNPHYLIEHWQEDLETYREIINHRFLSMKTQ